MHLNKLQKTFAVQWAAKPGGAMLVSYHHMYWLCGMTAFRSLLWCCCSSDAIFADKIQSDSCLRLHQLKKAALIGNLLNGEYVSFPARFLLENNDRPHDNVCLILQFQWSNASSLLTC